MASPKVQHVSKAASDKLLVKFSDVTVYDFVYNQSGGPSPDGKKKRAAGDGIQNLSPNVKNSRKSNAGVSASKELILSNLNGVNASRELFLGSGSVNSTMRKSTGLLRSVGSIKSSQFTVTRMKTSCLLSAAAEKAWRKALRGASKFLMDKQAMQPVRLRKELV